MQRSTKGKLINISAFIGISSWPSLTDAPLFIDKPVGEPQPPRNRKFAIADNEDPPKSLAQMKILALVVTGEGNLQPTEDEARTSDVLLEVETPAEKALPHRTEANPAAGLRLLKPPAKKNFLTTSHLSKAHPKMKKTRMLSRTVNGAGSSFLSSAHLLVPTAGATSSSANANTTTKSTSTLDVSSKMQHSTATTIKAPPPRLKQIRTTGSHVVVAKNMRQCSPMADTGDWFSNWNE
jgi:hypothetical protein